MTSLVRRGVLRSWYRFVRQGAVASQALSVQRLLLHQNKTVRTLVTSRRLFSQEPAQQLEASQDDSAEDESRSSSKTNRQIEHLDRQLYKLDMDVRRTGRTMPFDLDMIMSKITPDSPCTSNQALMVLRCCGSLLSDERAKQRTERVEKYWKTFQNLGICMDVSHYNALLKVHLENEHKVVPSDFLSHMEELGITPNRVTFQHMIGLYCLDGNITGATTILEHMKSQDMAINDSVFHYLLQGHCFNDDQASVDSTLEIMSSNGLDLGPDSVRVMSVTHAKAGRWEKVQEILAKAEEVDVKLSDGDVFEIIQGLCQAGLEAEAKQMVQKLPKKRGYFQELRSALPQIIFTGCIDLALEIFFTFKVVPTKTSNDHHDETERRDKGAFIVRSIVKAETGVDKLLDVVEQMKEAGYSDWLWLVVEASIQFGSLEYCEMIGRGLAEKLGNKFMDRKQLFPFVRKQVISMSADGNAEKIVDILNKIRAMGLNVPKENVSNDVIPALLDLKKETPADVLHMLRNAVPSMNWIFLSNSMIQSLLNQEKLEYFQACSGFVLNARVGSMYPDGWNSSLARSYLITESLEDLVNVLFVASRPENHPKSSRQRDDGANFNTVLFRSLSHIVSQAYRYRPDEEKADVLRAVVQELVRHRIGIPLANVETLKGMVEDSDLHELLDEAAKQFEDDYWTQENTEKFLEERRKLFGRNRRERSPRNNTNYTGFFEIPDDISEMEKIKSVLEKRGETNNRLTNNLIKSYATAGQVEKSIELLNTTDNFTASPTIIQEIVENLVSAGKIDQALDFYRIQRDEGLEIFSNTPITICIGLAKEGKHAAVLDLLGEDFGKLISRSAITNNLPLLEHYVQAGDVENLSSVYEAMGRADLIKISDSKVLGKLVQVHLVREDTKAAVEEFERICNQYRRLPHKFSLMQTLIEDEDLEAMQKVLDLSIDTMGEEKSLYDLAHNFLSSGKKAQTKKLFETPGLRYNHYKMEYLCQKLFQTNLEALEDLVMLSKSIFGCDRDFMYLQLVKAYGEDPTKALEIWINIQEEGLAPSDKLKIEIANVLQAAGKPVPFEVPENPSQVERPITEKDEPKQKKEERVNRLPQTRVEGQFARETEAKEERMSNKNRKDSVFEIVNSANIEAKLSALAENGDNRGLHTSVLDNLVKTGRLEEACKVANEVKTYKTFRTRRSIDGLFQKLKVSERLDLLTSLTDGFDEDQKAFYKVEQWIMSAKAFNNPQEYLTIVRTSPDHISSTFPLLSRPALTEAMEKNKELGDGLNALANEGSEVAAILLARAAIENGDKTELVKNWNLLKDKELASDQIFNTGSFKNLEKVRWFVDVLKELDATKDAFKKPYEFFFRNKKNNASAKGVGDDVISEALDYGIELKELHGTFLKSLSIKADSKFKDDALRILTEKQSSD